MKRSIKIGEHSIPLWLIVVLLISIISVGVLADYIWKTIFLSVEIKEPLEIVSYPSILSLYPGETKEFNVTLRNHASRNYTVILNFSLDNETYQNLYVTFSHETYTVVSGQQNLLAWLKVEPYAPPTNTSLTIDLRRVYGIFSRISSGKIAYDTFSAFDGTATDVPWTIVQDLYRGGNWTVEDGKFKSKAEMGNGVMAYITGIEVTDCVFEVKVKPMLLTQEGPELILIWGLEDYRYFLLSFDYYASGNALRAMNSEGVIGWSSFTMTPATWYTMKVEIFGYTMKCYVDGMLKLNVTDSEIGESPPRNVGIGGFYNGEWGYWDDVKVWKSNIITMTNLQEGQRVELYDSADNLKASDIIGEGETNATLDVSTLTFPFEGYFKIYSTTGTVLHTTLIYEDIWGGDIYSLEVEEA